MTTEAVQRDELLKELAAECYYDPLKWVLAIYPWGMPGTFLEEEPGPDTWQIEVLQAIGEELLLADTGRGASNAAQIAIGSGHGTGKGALCAWIMQWWLSTRRNPAGNATAGTDTQLKTKTWRELNKWWRVSANKDWFSWTATKFELKEHPLSAINAIPWSESNPQAFAGLHEGDPIAIFDEASTVADIIWTTQEGGFTTPGGLWLAVGNLTEGSGKLHDCFESNKKYWRRFNIDARNARKADKKRIAQWEEQYGVDSDFFRVRVMGLPPKGGGDSRIFTVDMIDAAVRREIAEEWIHEETPIVMGIDPAGGGANLTALVIRRGPLIKPEWIVRYSEGDTMRNASLIATYLAKFKPDYAFIDAHGIGKGIYDRLRQLGYFQVIAVYGGDRSVVENKLNYYNPRAEWYGRLSDWLRFSKIPNDRDLRDQLLRQPMERRQGRLQLMSKEDMRKIGLESPDTSDAASLTFAELVSVKANAAGGLAMEGGLPIYT